MDGYIDDLSTQRLPLSNAEDFDRIDQVRSESNAILLGATTVRRDNPSLLIRSAQRRDARVARGLPEHPLKVTVTSTGDLDPELQLWHHGAGKLVYTTDACRQTTLTRLGNLAKVVSLGSEVVFGDLLDDLGTRGVDRLLVEGGGQIHTAFLAAGLADEIRMAVAPMLVGQATAPRFLNPTDFPGGPQRRFHLDDVTKLGDVAVLRYFPNMTPPRE